MQNNFRNKQLYKLIGGAYSSVRKALKAAKQNAGKDDLIMVAGSVFVVAEVLQA
jgi:dihydrofolate synthase/folylpolyglutamate synthase